MMIIVPENRDADLIFGKLFTCYELFKIHVNKIKTASDLI